MVAVGLGVVVEVAVGLGVAVDVGGMGVDVLVGGGGVGDRVLVNGANTPDVPQAVRATIRNSTIAKTRIYLHVFIILFPPLGRLN